MKHQKELEWTRLDNASKIFPATWNMKDTKVFRIACELFEAVEPGTLQEALDMTIDNFPLYKTVLKRGAFWYFLEESEIRPVVQTESSTVCAPIYVGLKNNLLFRVLYYNNRINLEVFHALSDGAGALQFLQSLIDHYLIIGQKEKGSKVIYTKESSSISRKMDDSFGKHFVGGNIFSRKKRDDKKEKKIRAYHIHGNRSAENRMNLIEGSMSAKDVLDKAHEYNTTLTIFIAALFMYSIYKEMPARRKNRPVVLLVPVDLRQFFESVTARNFFSYINVGYKFEGGTHELDDVIRSISESFRNNLTVEQLNLQLNNFMALERNPFTRAIPLQLKNYAIRIVTKFSDKQITTNISNLGKISMPREYSSAIRQFSVCSCAKRPLMTLCSYNDRLVVSITSPFRETDIQRTFFRLLSEAGIEIEISSNT